MSNPYDFEKPTIHGQSEMLKRLTDFFTTPTPPLWRYCLACVPVAMLPSVLLLAMASWVLAAVGVDEAALLPVEGQATVTHFLGSVVVSPIVETLVLGWMLRALSKLTERRLVLCGISSAAWGLLHGLVAPLWFLGTAWSFFVFSAAYLAWLPSSRTAAFQAAAVPHAAINFIVFVAGALQK